MEFVCSLIPFFPEFLSCVPFLSFLKMARSFPCVQTLLKFKKFALEPVDADGNCFYRAVSKGYYKDVDMHHMLRRTTIDNMIEDAEKYENLFESKKSMLGMLNANKRLGVWNSDLADLVPQAVANLLNCRLVIYAVAENDEVKEYSFGEGDKIRLLLKDNHYSLLIKD